MANTLNKDIDGMWIVLAQSAFDETLHESQRTVKVTGGFGSVADANLSYRGGALYVEFPDGSTATFRGMDVESLAETK